MDIIIYTTPETLEHKKGGDGGKIYYWEIYRSPKNFKVGERVYFAVKGHIVGSFKCMEYNPEKDECGDPLDTETIVWDCGARKNSALELKEYIELHTRQVKK